MKISEVEKLMGLEQGTIASGVKVEVTMPNVGGGKVTMVGTSTGAFFSILLMAGAVVLFGLLGKKKGLQKSWRSLQLSAFLSGYTCCPCLHAESYIFISLSGAVSDSLCL